jgi:uncharacterized membrane protein YhiD involved in acid resistance
MAASIILGSVLALGYSRFNNSSKGFIITIAILPAMVQMVILLVNGNLGTGIAVMGAFSLVRFRSIPGSAKDIAAIFMSMAVGLATGTGYIAVAVLFVVIVGGISILYTITDFGESKQKQKELKITIPESVNYMEVFNDLFKEYTVKNELVKAKTSNMGSLYKLNYLITLKDPSREKEFLDKLRCRNGNLEIACGRVTFTNDEL